MSFRALVKGYMGWKRTGVLHPNGPGGVAVRKVVSQYHRHSAWQRTMRWWVYIDTGMMEIDWETGEYGDTEVTEREGVTSSIHSGQLRLDSHHPIESFNKAIYCMVPNCELDSLIPRCCGSTQLC